MKLKLINNSKINIYSGYHPEYIESTGTQYIDTGISPTDSSLTFKIGCSNPPGVTSARFGYDFGGSGVASTFANIILSNGKVRINWGSYDGNDGIILGNFNDNELIDLEIKPGTFVKLNGIETPYEASSVNSFGQNFSLFARVHGKPPIGHYCCSSRIHYFIVKDSNNNEIIHLVPEIDSNNVVCMYDVISETRFYNGGTGELIASEILAPGEINNENNNDSCSKVTQLFVKNCPEISGIKLLRNLTNLTRVRCDIGSVSSSVNELITYKTLSGFDDSENLIEKPRLVGTWNITDYMTPELLNSKVTESDFSGLSIVADSDHLLRPESCLIQSFDSTRSDYNPAAVIHLKDYARTVQFSDGSVGAAILLSDVNKETFTFCIHNKDNGGNNYDGFNVITDDTGICVDSYSGGSYIARSYELTSIEFLEKLTNCSTFNIGIYGCNHLSNYVIKLPPNITTLKGNRSLRTLIYDKIVECTSNITSLNLELNNDSSNFHRYMIHLINIPDTFSSMYGMNCKLFLGLGENYIADQILVDSFNSIDPTEVDVRGLGSRGVINWYSYVCPQLTYDNGTTTVTVERTPDLAHIYYKKSSDDEWREMANSGSFSWDGNGYIVCKAEYSNGDVYTAENFYAQTVSTPIPSYTNDGKVQIISDPDATIYYTLDGSSPYINGIEYTEPITVSDIKTRVKCYAVCSGKNQSELVDQTIVSWDNFAVQTLDSTKPNYNPAVAIRLNAASYGTVLPEPIISGGGRYYLTKNQAIMIKGVGTNDFNGVTSLSDTNNIIDGNTHNFTTFNEFQYFTSFAFRSNLRSFYNCTNLTSITLPSHITALSQTLQFSNCSSLVSINLDNITTLNGSNCFAGCTLLNITSLSSNCTYIGGGAFQGCSNITINTLPIGITELYGGSFSGTTSIPYLHLLSESPIIIPDYIRTAVYSAFRNTTYNFYVGNGSEGRDNAIKELYVAAPGWNKMTSYIDTWYNFAAPHINYEGGTVTITCERTPDNIYYTTDGSTPTVESTKYTGPFQCSNTSAIKAVGIDNRGDCCYSEYYAQTTPTPVITKVDNTHIQITCSDPGATIYYTLDGTSPYLSGKIEYTGEITTDERVITVKCYATCPGKNISEEIGEIFILDETVYGTDEDTSYFAIQSIDSTKPNFNPLPLSKLYEKRLVITGVENKCGYLTKTDASTITNFLESTFNGLKTQANCTKKLFNPNDSYSFEYFNEIKYFTNLISIPVYCFYNSGIKRILVPDTCTSIIGQAFAGPNIDLIEFIGYNVTSLAYMTFSSASHIKDLIIPNLVEMNGYNCLPGSNLDHNYGTLCIKRVNNGNHGAATFKRVLITDAVLSGGIKGITYTEEIRVLGNCTGYSAGLCPNSSSTLNSALKFIEVMGDVIDSSGEDALVTDSNKDVILHLGKTSVVSALPSIIGVGVMNTTNNTIPAISNIYVGTGASESGDNAIKTAYLNDSNWSSYASIIDTWWSYNGEYKTYRLNDSGLANFTKVSDYSGTAVEETLYAGYFFGLKKEGSLSVTLSAEDGYSISDLTVTMWDMDIDSPTYNTEINITSQCCTVDNDSIIVNIPTITGNVSISG